MGGTTKYVLGAVVVIAAVIGAFLIFGGDSEESTTAIEETTDIAADATPSSLPVETVRDTAGDFRPPDLEKVHFDFDRYSIRSDAVPALDANAAWLRQHPDVRVVLEGYCDERGTEEYNLTLGDRRARAVQSQLVRRGLSPARIETLSYGKSRPEVPNAVTDAGHERNRRVLFRANK